MEMWTAIFLIVLAGLLYKTVKLVIKSGQKSRNEKTMYKKAKQPSSSERAEMNECIRTIRRLEERLNNIETIIKDEMPDWPPQDQQKTKKDS